jgi:hypothetical protein
VRHSVAVNLLLYYLGFGFVLLLAWAAVLYDAVRREPQPSTTLAVRALRVLGIVHPAAAIAAWDLRRELARDGAADGAPAGRFPLEVAASLVVAAAVVVATGR